MAKERNALRAGIFMIVSVALVIFVIIAISGAGRFTQSFNTYQLSFSLTDDVGGLRVGDDVRIGGVRVGSVRDIEIRKIPAAPAQKSAENTGVVVVIDVPQKYPLAKDAHAFVKKDLTGPAMINIEDLGSGTQLASTDFLPAHPDAFSAFTRRLGAMEPDLHEIVTNVKTASGKLNTDLDKLATTADSFSATGFSATATIQDLHVRMPGLLSRYDDLVTAAIHMLDVVANFVGPSSGDFRTTLANLGHISGDLRERMPDLLNQMRGILQKVDVSVSRANSALTDIQAAVANTRDVTASLRGVIVDNKSKLESMIASLKTTSDNLKYASVEIRHSPWRLLYQPKPEEVANLNTYDSVRQFAEGANSLDDAAAALRDALNNKNADPEQVKRLMEHLNETFAKFQDVQQKLWKDIK